MRSMQDGLPLRPGNSRRRSHVHRPQGGPGGFSKPKIILRTPAEWRIRIARNLRHPDEILYVESFGPWYHSYASSFSITNCFTHLQRPRETHSLQGSYRENSKSGYGIEKDDATDVLYVGF